MLLLKGKHPLAFILVEADGVVFVCVYVSNENTLSAGHSNEEIIWHLSLPHWDFSIVLAGIWRRMQKVQA